MTTVITESTDIFHTFTKEQRAKAYEEWSAIEESLKDYIVETLEYYGITVNDPIALTFEEPDDVRDKAIEAGEDYLNEVCTSDLLTDFLVYAPHGVLLDTPYDMLADDAETIEEHDEWAARAILWSISLRAVVDIVLWEHVEALETLNTDLAEEYRKAWYLG